MKILHRASGKLIIEAENLSGADLSWADLRGFNLSGADLSRANLRGANLIGSNLSGANLSGANLRGADLRGANLSGANLSGADLNWADLSERIYTISNIGSANRQTTYNADKNIIWCGCFTGTIEDFEAQVIKTHTLPGNEKHYSNYMAAITYFKSLK